MSDSSGSGDELPDIAVGSFRGPKPYIPTKINVDAEIAENLARQERRKQIDLAVTEYNITPPASPKITKLPKPKIQSLPPNRLIFDPERSLISLNEDNLTTEQFFPSDYQFCTSENVDVFFYWIRSNLKTSSNDVRRKFLQYLWLLLSCHSDPYVVQKCCDVLVEHNTLWRLKYEEVVFVICNWGVTPENFITGLDSRKIKATLKPSAVISHLNVEAILHVLDCQLMLHDLEGSDISLKALFVFLVLLPLDIDFLQCLSVTLGLLERLSTYAESRNKSWVADYCMEIFRFESHHAQVAFLLECVVPESMRWCLCLAYCQKVFSLEQNFLAQPEPNILKELLLDHTDEFMQLESWDLYSLISIVDSGISCVINYETDKRIKQGFQEWLSQYMVRRSERRSEESEDIDVDAALLAELVSRLQAEWESKWLEEPGSLNRTTDDVENEDMIVQY